MSLQDCSKLPVIVIFAPTACGKTQLIKQLFGKSSISSLCGIAEVISADSQSVYKNMNIGTAKPSIEEQDGIPYHLIDVLYPHEQFGVGNFLEECDSLCKQIYLRNKIPVVAGGTGFYIRSFLYGLPPTPISDSAVRESLKEEMLQKGRDNLYNKLKEVDPLSASRININDEYRIIRALEVFYISGKPLSSIQVPSILRKEYDFCMIILERERKELYKRIDMRVEQMFKNGLAREIEELKNSGYDKDTPGMKAIGYCEFFTEPKSSLNSIKSKIKLNSRHYAKKQYTYMKNIQNAIHIGADDYAATEKVILDFLQQRGELK